MKKFRFILFSLFFAITALNPVLAESDNENRISKKSSSIELQSWSIKIDNASKRFVILDAFDGAAVLDKETQLVWERSPSERITWPDAISFCYNKNVGGRMGWRLPTIEEFASLLDASTNDHLPAGHPFDINASDPYWSATTYGAPGYTGNVWTLQFDIGQPGYLAKTLDLGVWCVRGGHGYDGGLNP